MWKATVGRTTNANVSKPITTSNDDEWETDADFVNDVSEREQRWGAKTVQGSGRVDAVNIDKLRDDVKKDDESVKQQEYEHSQMKPSVGYGGKFGVQKDRVDKSAVGWEYQAQLEKHASQKDYSQGFGGKYGVLSDRKDKSAVGFEHVENLSKHASQTDYSKGFGGKYGVNTDRKDQSAVGFDHVENVPKHSSQVDYSKGFGGKFGVNSDRKDQSAVGFDHVEKLTKHSSQIDYSKGFGGKFGVEKDKMDKSAAKFEDDSNQVVGTNYQRTRADSKTDVKGIKSKFESTKIGSSDESKKRVDEIRAERMNKDLKDRELEKKFIPSSDSNENKDKSSDNTKPKIGKININSAFLGGSNQQQSTESVKPKTEPGKINKSNVGFNRFNLASNNNNTNNNKQSSPPAPAVIQQQHSNVEEEEQQQQQQSYYSNETREEPVISNNINKNTQPVATIQMPTPAPIPVLAPPSNHSYYNNNNDHETNEDEWNDDDSPPVIKPTIVANTNLDHYQEEYSNINDNNDIYENNEPINNNNNNFNNHNAINHQNGNHNNNNNNNGVTNKKAVALYDFVASEQDELSFDPNDIIENIQELDEGWWQGTCKGRFGLFPSNYVQLLEN